MRVVVSPRVFESFKKIIPELSILFLVILSVQPQNLFGNSVISPFLCLSAVFYWSLHRQSRFYVVTLIILGVISDILIGASLGFTPILFLIVFAISSWQKKNVLLKPFHLIWGIFSLVSGITFVVAWGITSFVSLQYVGVGPFAIQYIMTVISFPILDWLLSHIQRKVAV